MEKIPTAEEILKEETIRTLNIVEDSPLHKAVISAMKRYAKLHVEAALKEVWNNSEEWENGLSDTIRVIDNDEESFLNSYPLENIK